MSKDNTQDELLLAEREAMNMISDAYSMEDALAAYDLVAEKTREVFTPPLKISRRQSNAYY